MDKFIIKTPHSASNIIDFAAIELQKYLCKANLDLYFNNSDFQLIYHLKLDNNLDSDGFSIAVDDNNIYLIGLNERSVLFAVYTYLEKYIGFSWPHVGEDVYSNKSIVYPSTAKEDFKPDFFDRGFNLETGFTDDDMLSFVDWIAKNRMNTVAIPFHCWDKFKDIVSQQIIKRGIKLVLSGHSYFKFLPKEKYYADNPQWYALIDGKRKETGQLCFANKQAIDTLYKNVLDYLNQQPTVSRLSIWPADNKQLCECEQCSQFSFLENYCRFTSNLKSFLADKGYVIEVDHLAYNAALSETMLHAPDNADAHENIDTQLAFWGRNYKFPLAESPILTDQKSKDTIVNWSKLRQAKSQSLYILEYYTDYWMLSPLFPPLTNVIAKDMSFYKSIGVQGMYSLCVGCSFGFFKGKGYPWQWRQGLNMYVFAKACWDSNLDVDAVSDAYFTDYYGEYAQEATKIFKILEQNLPSLTSCNIPLFRLRFVDIWQRDETPEEGGVMFDPQDWHPEQCQSNAEKTRALLCKEVTQNFIKCTPKSFGDKKSIYYDRYMHAYKYYDYCKNKLIALNAQLEAQQAIQNGDKKYAIKCLQQALSLQHKLYNQNIDNCNKWLKILTE